MELAIDLKKIKSIKSNSTKPAIASCSTNLTTTKSSDNQTSCSESGIYAINVDVNRPVDSGEQIVGDETGIHSVAF